MRRGIAMIAGSTIAAAVRLACQRRPIAITPRPASLSRRIVGTKATEIGRLGKRVVIGLSSGDSLIFEPRMTGLVLVADPPSQEHLRFRLDLQGGPIPHVWYWDRRGLGSIRLLSKAQLAEQLGSGRLGPDALSLSPAELRQQLGSSRRSIKVALLDQRAIAGIGNLYASEILHLAQVHPESRCDQLKPHQWELIHRWMLAVLEDAIRHQGSTLSDGTYRNALNQSGGYQSQHRVYDRAGKPCPACDATIVRVVQAQRTTFYCPQCQKKRRNR